MKIHNVEQGSDEWHKLRAGKPTASMFSSLITPKTRKPSSGLETYAYELAAEKFAGGRLDPWVGNVWTDRGHELEPEAFKEYNFSMNMPSVQIGFATNDEETYGASPDRAIGDDGLLEIKCLKAENHVKNVTFVVEEGECPPDYFLQIQGEMFVTERDWVDLYLYHDVLPSLAHRVEPDIEIFGLLDELLPKLITRRDEIYEILMNLKEG